MSVLSIEQVQKVIDDIGNDGHTVYKEEKFDYLPAEFVSKFVENIASSTRDPKYMIFDKEGNVIPEVRAVHGLRLLCGVAVDVGADSKEANEMIGRGFKARAITEAIQKKISQ